MIYTHCKNNKYLCIPHANHCGTSCWRCCWCFSNGLNNTSLWVRLGEVMRPKLRAYLFVCLFVFWSNVRIYLKKLGRTVHRHGIILCSYSCLQWITFFVMTVIVCVTNLVRHCTNKRPYLQTVPTLKWTTPWPPCTWQPKRDIWRCCSTWWVRQGAGWTSELKTACRPYTQQHRWDVSTALDGWWVTDY